MQNLKQNYKIIVFIVLLLVVIISFLVVYHQHFPGGISNNHSIWTEFGTIFNGVLTPILTAINIYVFFLLTIAIDNNNERRQREKSENDKTLLQMQFRKSEIDRFDEAISTALMPKVDMSNDYQYLHSISLAIYYIDSFIENKFELFDLDDLSGTRNQMCQLGFKLREYQNIVDKEGNYPNRELVSTIYNLKFSIMRDLQKITLGEKIS